MYVIKRHLQFCLIVSLIARVHRKVRSLSKSKWLVQPITNNRINYEFNQDLHNSLQSDSEKQTDDLHNTIYQNVTYYKEEKTLS